jgi:ribulose 1,5-bisphosphate synthetase/thiazole synthase
MTHSIDQGELKLKTIFEPGRDIPIIAETDVLVVGGGTAGLPAALAAARSGVDVLVLERYGYVGGASSGGLVITLPADRQGVITRELEERLLEVGGAAIMDDDWLAWCPETLKWMGLKMLEEASARMLFHSWCVGCVVENSRIDSVIIESKAGRQAIKAKIVVDCTGDADVAAFSGAPYTKGDDDGKMIGVTMMFMMSSLNEEEFKSGKPLTDPPQRMGRRITSIYPGHLNVWGGRIDGIDGTDPWDLTRAENELRKQVFEWAFWAKKDMPGCEDAYISMTSPQLGVRETRLIMGEYRLSKADWDAKTMFPDHIGFAYESKSIPYRSILPKKVENLLVGGRCVSFNRDILDPMRLIPPCMVTGYAAGMAAALSVQDNTTPRELDVTKLQSALKKSGVTFP